MVCPLCELESNDHHYDPHAKRRALAKLKRRPMNVARRAVNRLIGRLVNRT